MKNNSHINRKLLSNDDKSSLLSRFVLWVFVPLVTLLAVVYWHLTQSLPQPGTRFEVEHISDQAQISRDDQGAVYIDAKTDNDAFFALGFAHAQDRLWQLELQRRMVQGRLSEVFGAEFVSRDAWTRTLGIYASAQQSWLLLSSEAKSSLTAYAAGINARIAQKPVLPIEFRLLGIKPQPWTETDSLAWSKMYALTLSDGMWAEIEAIANRQVLKPSQLLSLSPHYQPDAPMVVKHNTSNNTRNKVTDLLSMRTMLQQQFNIGYQHAGSNAWVVAGKYTDNHQPILANDPHLGLHLPSSWYVADIKGATLNVSGMTLVGMPVMVLGKNNHIAWGTTALAADVQDLYLESVDRDNPGRYRHNGQWLEFTEREEIIDIGGGFMSMLKTKPEPAVIKVRTSVNGPIISDGMGELAGPVALKCTSLLPGDTTYESLFQLNYATDWAGFKQALSYHVAPNLNMLYSDTQGNIGYTAAGKIPIRSNGDGSTISAGGGTDNIWTGFIPVDELPQSFNPVKGYIVSANNKIIDDSYGYFISNDWALPARAERIEQLLDQAIEAQQPINIDTMAKMQLDSIDRSALPLIELLQHYQATSPRQKEVLVLLTGWNASMAGDSIAATVFTVWMKHLKQTLFERSVTDYWNSDINIPAVINRLSEDTNNQQIERMLTDDSGLWCAALSHCNAELSTALDSAIGEMDKYAGSNTDNWAWGQFQSAVFEHIPFSFVNILDQIFERRISNGGSANTINVSSSTFELSKGYEQKFGTALRQIIQPANPLAEVFYINTTGQSGNVLSPHYDDSIVSFNQGKLRRLAEPLSTGAVTTLQPKEK